MDLGETLTPRTTPSEECFVQPLNPRAVDGPHYQKMYGLGMKWGMSIETAHLRFAHIRERSVSVHGTIHINGEHGCLHTLYNRSSEEPQKLSSPSGGYLSLSGPRYFLNAAAPTFMYVILFEVGIADPFLHQRVPLDLPKIRPAQTVTVSVDGGLTITMTVIAPATLTDISLELYYPDSYNNEEWLVSGSVTVIQTISQGNKTRSVPLFYRPIDEPLRAVHVEEDDDPGRSKARISPDRKAFLAPLLFDKSSIEKKNRALQDAGLPSSCCANPDNPFYNGVGSFHSIDVDLRFANSGKFCIVQGSLHYQFKCTHEHEAVFRASLKLPRLSTDEEGIELVISLKPWFDIECSMNGEPDECQHPLYVPPIEYIYIDSSDTDTEDGPMEMHGHA